MQTHLSPEAQVMVRPFRAYPLLVAQPDATAPWLLWLRRPALMLATLGAFVALSAAGRLVLWHVLFAAAFWVWAPIYQALSIAATVRLLAPKSGPDSPVGPSVARSVDLYFMGHGAWYVLLLSLVAIAFAAPDVYAAFSGLLRSFVLPGVLLGTILWSWVITFAFFRRGLGWSRGRSWGGLGLFYGLIIAFLLVWYIPTGQLLPAIKGL